MFEVYEKELEGCSRKVLNAEFIKDVSDFNIFENSPSYNFILPVRERQRLDFRGRVQLLSKINKGAYEGANGLDGAA